MNDYYLLRSSICTSANNLSQQEILLSVDKRIFHLLFQFFYIFQVKIVLRSELNIIEITFTKHAAITYYRRGNA